MIKMPVKEQVKSKGMIAGWFLIGLGSYIAVIQSDVTGGGSIIGIGLAVLGLRDAK